MNSTSLLYNTYQIEDSAAVWKWSNIWNKQTEFGSSRNGLVGERLLHKKCHSATMDRILSKYGVSIVQKWKHFVAIPIAGFLAALAVYVICVTNNSLMSPIHHMKQTSLDTITLLLSIYLG